MATAATQFEAAAPANVAWCEPCRLAGHYCAASCVVPGEQPKCIFCEDGEPCPRVRQAKLEHRPLLDGAVVKTRRHRGELVEVVPPPISKPAVLEKPMPRTCRECGAKVHALSKEDLCKAHNKARREKKLAEPRKPRAVRKTPPAPETIVAAEHGTAVALLVTEEQINRMFLAWPLEDKVLAIQAHLSRESGGCAC